MSINHCSNDFLKQEVWEVFQRLDAFRAINLMGKYVLVDVYSPLHFLSHIVLKTADTQLLNIDFLNVDSFCTLKSAVFQSSTRTRWLNCTPNQPTRGEEGQWNPARVAGRPKWVGGNETHQLLGKRQNVRMSKAPGSLLRKTKDSHCKAKKYFWGHLLCEQSSTKHD